MEKPDFIGLENGRWITASESAYKPAFARIAAKMKELGVKTIEELPEEIRDDYEEELTQIADIIGDSAK